MKILLTGGAGFVGIHTAVVLAEAGYQVALYDNFSNSSVEVIQRASGIIGSPIRYFEGDIRDEEALCNSIELVEADSIIHLAGLKSVPDSMQNPAQYWDVNFRGTLSVVRAALRKQVKRLVFSSSATVYANSSEPLSEADLTEPTSTYGRTKLASEHVLAGARLCGLRVLSLRYFNPVGTHPSGLIGEMPTNVPQNLFPVLLDVVLGRKPELVVYGNDYNTEDGSAVRDFIHVMDIADGHLLGLRYLETSDDQSIDVMNLGTGRGYSVLEVISTFESVIGRRLPVRFVERRLGDVPISVANSRSARDLLGWRPLRSLEQACRDALLWAQAEAQRTSQKTHSASSNDDHGF